MKIILILLSLFIGTNAFGVVGPSTRFQSSTIRYAWVPEEDMTPDQLEIKKIAMKWDKIRLMSREEAESLDNEWKEAYNRYYEKYDKNMEEMKVIAARLRTLISPPKIEKKTKGQKRRDAWAKVQARMVARAAAAK